MNIIIQLYLTFFKIGMFAYGGGYASQALLMQNNVLLDQDKLTSIIAVSQSLPGPFIVNTAVGYGYALAGIPGVFACILGALTPCLIITFLVIKFVTAFNKSKVMKGILYGIGPGVIGVIGSAAWMLASKTVSKSSVPTMAIQAIIAIVSFLVILKTRIHPIFLILSGGILGILLLR